MNNKDKIFCEESDLYEEILVYESLDQYEGLLNHCKNMKKDLKKHSIKRKNYLIIIALKI